MMQEKECTDIWRKYQAGKDHHNKANMYTRDPPDYRLSQSA